MPPPSSIVVLCEDFEHQAFVRALLHAEVPRKRLSRILRVEMVEGGRGAGTQHVLEGSAREVQALRTRHAVTWLVVVTDADVRSTRSVRGALGGELKRVEARARGASEPIAILVPKWEIESWILHLLGEEVTEDDRIDESSRRRASQGLTGAAEGLAAKGPPDDALPSLVESWSDYRSHILDRDA